MDYGFACEGSDCDLVIRGERVRLRQGSNKILRAQEFHGQSGHIAWAANTSRVQIAIKTLFDLLPTGNIARCIIGFSQRTPRRLERELGAVL
jgi:hypothetical protein